MCKEVELNPAAAMLELETSLESLHCFYCGRPVWSQDPDQPFGKPCPHLLLVATDDGFEYLREDLAQRPNAGRLETLVLGRCLPSGEMQVQTSPDGRFISPELPTTPASPASSGQEGSEAGSAADEATNDEGADDERDDDEWDDDDYDDISINDQAINLMLDGDLLICNFLPAPSFFGAYLAFGPVRE